MASKTRASSPVSRAKPTSKNRAASSARRRPNKSPAKLRSRRTRGYRSFKLSKPLKPNRPPIAGSWALIKVSLSQIMNHKLVFGLHILVASVLYGVFVRGFSQHLDLAEYKDSLGDGLGGFWSNVESSINVVAEAVIGSSGPGDELEAVYQVLITILVSMASMWLMRAVTSGSKLRLRDAYMFGPAQIVPFILVGLTIILQVIPFYFVAWMASILRDNNVLESAYEQFVAVSLIGLVGLLSLYLATGTVFAMIIVTIKGARPIASIKTSLAITVHRRWLLVGRVATLMLVMALFVSLALVVTAVIYAGAVEYAYFVSLVSSLIFAHAYMYNLYLEAIKD